MQEQRIDFLVRLARAYYEQGLTQEEIAKHMSISRSQISRYLTEARETGIIQFRVIDPNARLDSLSDELRARFSALREAIVVPVFSHKGDVARQMVGIAAAAYLREKVRPGDCFGIGCGRTIRAAISALKSVHTANLTVVQAMGSLGHEALDIDFNDLTRAAAEAFSARAYYVNAPAILGSGSAAELECANIGIRESLARARSSDVFLVGLGSLDTDQLYARAGLISESEIAWLRANRMAGDLCARFFDIDGCEHATPFTPRIVGVELKDIRHARLAIGVAAGRDKALPIRAALHGQWLNVIITDEETARAVIKLDDDYLGGQSGLPQAN